MEYSELNGQEPIISVGILCAPTIEFTLNGQYIHNGQTISGRHKVQLIDGTTKFDGTPCEQLDFIPSNKENTFSIHSVVIGIGFHWERSETQTFQGQMSIVQEENKLWAINRLPIEEYLYCVIASEMSATSSLELLKAHAVVSRSWLLAQLLNKHHGVQASTNNDNEYIKWYDRDDHTLFDVCADDHCQRYQGLTRVTMTKLWQQKTPVRRAIDETRGMVLISEDEVCDARFSKCCGGITETYDTCWDNTPKRYLQSFVDYTHKPQGYNINLDDETNAHTWINSNPDAFCNTQDASILKQVLNSYDQETADFYRWTIKYTHEELTDIVKKKTGIDFGLIKKLEPVSRGKSGRIDKLRIVGSHKTLTIGKELEIRRILSTSHLYSSAFVIEDDGSTFILHGAGWGHGVGMCQIGAAVMSERGFGFKSILIHYYRCATIESKWS